MHGCSDCRYCKVYHGSYWDPGDVECVGNIDDAGLTDEEIDTLIDRVWVNGEEWKDNEEPICPAWAEYIEPIYPEDTCDPDAKWIAYKERCEE